MAGLISVIVTTYNWPEALAACLTSLLSQHDGNFEIIIADDGSGAATQQLIAEFQRHSPIPIHHIRHEDKGFRAGTIRNKAAALSLGDYLLFMDGDCVALPSFVSRHRHLAESGYFVPGNRVLVSQAYTTRALEQQIPLHSRSLVFFLGLWIQRRINRFLPLIYLPFRNWRYRHPWLWQKAMTCNLAIWKTDFIAVNGFDEVFEGWGYEDSDLVIRLIHLGVRRKEGRFALPVFHLWHPHNDRSKHDQNYQRLLERLNRQSLIRAQSGVDQYTT
ncbi:MAG: glycosyltransferase family 2 protein [Methylomonas sp.]|jgi:glycosyltransferase involved in cell wall biosynthesis|uniref:glycosyltransferase family 2 protein n=1 Tax=Methylomonas sp. TaxID=418 RepID=UPI0025E81200|nr:glycosyltransferase family 2 protein [Methylomonas sp.]MCK9607109.1 glycosyltransferase family 2 protein [Methylomonas sp.]